MSPLILDIPDRLNVATVFIDQNVERGFGDKPAILQEDGSAVTYRDLQQLVNKTGNALAALGVEMENRVLILLPDGPEFVASFFGAIKRGAIPVPVNIMAKDTEYFYYLNDSRAKILIVHEQLLGEVEKIMSRLKYIKHVVVVGEPRPRYLSFHEMIGRASSELEAVETSKDDVAFWLYTSGSGGTPKGVVHLQHDMIYTSELYAKRVLGINQNDVTFSASKLFFAYGLGNAMYFPFSVGASTLLYPWRLKPEKIFELIHKFRPTLFFAVPTLYAAMLEVKDAEKRYDVGSLRLAVSAGEALPAELYHRFKKKFGIDILDGIGSTEMLHMFISNRPDDIKPGSSGKPVPGYEAKIIDEQGRTVATGEIGNLLVKGDSAAAYYWNKHDLTKRTIVGEWVVTGDKYYQDADGWFYYCGRTDDMLKVAGMWVSPIEVESALMAHPSVLECAVVGIRDSDGLVKPKAFVVLKQAIPSSPELPETLRCFLKEKLASYKCPHWIELVQELPKTATGKIQRFKLRTIRCNE